MKRGKGVREGTGPERGKRRKNEGKRVGGKGPESAHEKTLILAPLRFRSL